jgi:deazaflavin-dependent oxidoreductase (nitroreductase family)
MSRLTEKPVRKQLLLKAIMRLPIWLYRWNLGWLMGGRFLMLTHTGRKSGLERQAVIEVVGYDEQSGAYFVASGWGEKSDWYKNIQKAPQVKVQVRSRRFEAIAKTLSVHEAEARLWGYAQRYPSAFRELTGLMLAERLPATPENARKLAESIPVVELRPV